MVEVLPRQFHLHIDQHFRNNFYKLFEFLFYMVFGLHVCLFTSYILGAPEEGVIDHGTRFPGCVRATMWVLEIKLRSSERAVRDLIH